MVGLYLHIPFCIKKCNYCDFPSYGGVQHLLEPYVGALCQEIEAAYVTEKVDTIYFGGGTPSLLTSVQIEKLLDAIHRRFSVTSNAEITLEANPDSFSLAYAQALASLGVNRVSIGIQTFHKDLLKQLGRRHSALLAKKAVQAAADAGLENVSADLMVALPGETLSMVAADLQELCNLPITHASIYSLIVEPHTMLWDEARRQKIDLPSEERVSAINELVWQQMDRQGFEHYEISSYCRSGFASRHNSKYWQYLPYLGFGASAHSFYKDKRWANVSNLYRYMKFSGTEEVRDETVEITDKRAVEDYCFLALRMKQGIDYQNFKVRFGCSITNEFGHIIEQLIKQGLLQATGTGCCLTKEGLAYGNYVFSQFIRE